MIIGGRLCEIHHVFVADEAMVCMEVQLFQYRNNSSYNGPHCRIVDVCVLADRHSHFIAVLPLPVPVDRILTIQ